MDGSPPGQSRLRSDVSSPARDAQLVVDSIRRGEQLDHYELYAFVVMANHVHVLIHPHVDPSRLLKSLKGATAREANKLLGRTREPFWQKESYDHWVRDHAEFERIKVYIENNPVKAGLVKAPEQYPWSSASVEKSLDAARKGCVRHTLNQRLWGRAPKLYRMSDCTPNAMKT